MLVRVFLGKGKIEGLLNMLFTHEARKSSPQDLFRGTRANITFRPTFIISQLLHFLICSTGPIVQNPVYIFKLNYIDSIIQSELFDIIQCSIRYWMISEPKIGQSLYRSRPNRN